MVTHDLAGTATALRKAVWRSTAPNISPECAIDLLQGTIDEVDSPICHLHTRTRSEVHREEAYVFDTGPLSHFAEAGWLKILQVVTGDR